MSQMRSQRGRGATSDGLADPADCAMISPEEAGHLVLAMVSPLAPARVALSAASGYVLAETVRAAEAVPRFANSAMDGYALRARPVVGVLSTGDELAAPGDALLPGKIRDANRPALLAQLRRDGFPGLDLGISADDQDVLWSRLEAGASRCDALIATGGVSAGDHDLLKVALEKLGGGTMRRLHVAVKPGKHLAVASLGRRHVPAFALPGNPVAALVAYELFVRSALLAMAGCPVPSRPRIAAIAETDLPRHPGPKLHAMRVIARAGPDGIVRVRPSGGQDSHMLRAMALANALALVPGGSGVRAGGRVEVVLLDAVGL